MEEEKQNANGDADSKNIESSTNQRDEKDSLPDQPNLNSNNLNNLNEPFKKPQVLIGSQRGKKSHSKLSKVKEQGDNVTSSVKTADKEQNSEGNSSIAAAGIAPQDKSESEESKKPPPLPYNKPEWGGIPNSEYKLEELKNGTIVKTIDLTLQSFFVFGRLENCDIAMLHPTVSRYHAILQYRSTGEDESEPGFYIYDLGSSLGTFVNKQKIKPKTFIRVKVGYIVKIGCSTRMFVLQGPAEDEEPESELSVTELRQQQKEKLAVLEAEAERRKAEDEERLRKESERGIDWGMGEDADEETDLSENPYAATLNEELYLDDPKKTLRGWFEREGEELEYNVEEKGFGHYICRIELPVDNGGGGCLVAEASVKGKKKEAVVQAALEACRLLDRQGLLRQSNHESKKKASKDWEANDFYDSDEDNFLDRTGQIEKKRQQRMVQSGKVETVVETYETLTEKYAEIVKELERTEKRLNEMLSAAARPRRDSSGQDQWEDDLDAYMDTLRQQPVDRLQLKKTKDEVAKLRAEEGRIRNLVNLSKPTELPKLEPAITLTEKKPVLSQGMIGKKPIKKRPHHKTEVSLPLQTTQQQSENESKEEFDDDEEEASMKTDLNEAGAEVPNSETVSKKKRSRTDTRIRHSKPKPLLKEEEVEDYSNCRWKPPEGQTGDGRTSLNDKYGY